MTARPASWALAVAVLLGGCGGARERPEPPSGAVDPGSHGLATPGADPAGARVPAGGSDPVIAAGVPRPGAPAVRAAPSGEPVHEAAGKMVMTREHCETLGRKFAQLTLQQGGMLGELGAGSAGDHEAAGVGKTFSDGCVRDLVGQTVEVREYQCMLRAKSPDDLLACRR